MSITAVPIQPVNRRYLMWLWIGIAVAVVAAFVLAFHGTGRAVAMTGSDVQFLSWNAGQPGVEQTASGLQYRVVKEGEGDAHPTDQDVALIEYKGSLRDGTVFDQSQQPTPLPVAGSIPGFSEALKLMRKGATYRIWVPANLAYGERSPAPALPAHSMLTFDLTLVDFLPEAVIRQMQMQQMQGGMPGAPGAPQTPPTPAER